MPQMPPQRKAGFPVMLRQFDKQILYNPYKHPQFGSLQTGDVLN